MSSYEQLFTELTLEVQANICGGVDTQTTKNAADESRTKSRIGRGRARILVDLGEGLPDKNIRNENGECRTYFDNLTGKFTFSCVLRDSGIFGDEQFPDL
ncbi:hypothetical protein IQ259_14315 [Fortiea sp. LEGE XX443]|uniref:hypothetical protein n=1 Tax=Fortiea sp. LEGE XX443 TaxID=1828611 RepID=UPI0018816864|nr:hypothetical protein [Fortiea sp. LEGE XX443]MBE9006197.1 hypothetical protein [Fortiea sp. LEGE XX443]